jgi:radical SAM superfamily enzyme YgiQ (UPF0313 family)
MKYRDPLFRPPAEADSLIFQISYGCPHNTCTFCGMYKSVKYEIKDFYLIQAEIKTVAKIYPETRRIFLADGDVMNLDFLFLKNILKLLNSEFKNLSRVNLYSNASSILSKTTGELESLKKLKLNTLYIGLESGSDKILTLVRKNEKADKMTEAVQILHKTGLKSSVLALLGLGGKELSQEHAEKTALALNRMQPNLLSILRFIEVNNSPVFKDYKPLSEFDAVNELLAIVTDLDLKRTVFTANHASNPLPLKGRLPHDKQKLIQIIKTMLHSGKLDTQSPGTLPLFL